jgi:hypothetical protein
LRVRQDEIVPQMGWKQRFSKRGTSTAITVYDMYVVKCVALQATKFVQLLSSDQVLAAANCGAQPRCLRLSSTNHVEAGGWYRKPDPRTSIAPASMCAGLITTGITYVRSSASGEGCAFCAARRLCAARHRLRPVVFLGRSPTAPAASGPVHLGLGGCN